MKTSTARNYPLEAEEHKAFVNYLEVLRLPHFHVPNEQSQRAYRMVNRKLGVSSGVPDLFVIVKSERNGRSKLIAIEMKRQRGARPTVSPKQKLWLEELKRAGIDGYVAYGATEAIEIVRDELDKLRKEDDNGEVF